MHPDMTISIREPHRQFFDGMLAVASASGIYETCKHLSFDKLLEMNIANFAPTDQMGQRDMFGQLTHIKNAGSRIRVDVPAARWDPDLPTYELFACAARHICGGLLFEYNREHDTRYRLTIPKTKSMLPWLVERFWRTLKYEEVNLKAYADARDAQNQIGAFIDRYNTWRPHSAHGDRVPQVRSMRMSPDSASRIQLGGHCPPNPLGFPLWGLPGRTMNERTTIQLTLHYRPSV